MFKAPKVVQKKSLGTPPVAQCFDLKTHQECTNSLDEFKELCQRRLLLTQYNAMDDEERENTLLEELLKLMKNTS